MKGSWHVARRNLLRNKRRNLATGMAIALGFAAMVALGGYMVRVEKYLQIYTIYANRIGHITIYKKGGFEHYSAKPRLYSLDPEDQRAITSALTELKQVEFFGAQFHGTGLIGNGCKTLPFFATGLDPQLEKKLREHPALRRSSAATKGYAKGKMLHEYPESLSGIIVAGGLAQLLQKPLVYDELPADHKPVLIPDCRSKEAKSLIGQDTNVQLVTGTWSGTMGALDAEIVAQINTGLTETQNTAVLLSLSQMQSLFGTPNVTFYSVWLKSPLDTENTIKGLKAKLGSLGKDYDIYPWTNEGINQMYTGTMQFLKTLVTFLGVVLALTVMFSIFNSGTMTVIERSQEIGMMRSIGFAKHEVRLLFVKEVFLLASLGLVAGSVIAAFGIIAINRAGIVLQPPGIEGGLLLDMTPNALSILGAASATFLLAIVTTILSVRNVTQKPITHLLMGSNR